MLSANTHGIVMCRRVTRPALATAPWPASCVHTDLLAVETGPTPDAGKRARRNVGIWPAKLTVPSTQRRSR